MKRLLALLLVLTTLAGCTMTQPTEAPTQPTEAPTDAPTAPPAVSLYQSGSEIEIATSGAVRSYRVGSNCDGMLLTDNRVVLYYQGDQTQLKSYEGNDLTQVAVASTHALFAFHGEGIQVVGKEIFYYDASDNALVIFNEQLHERNRWELPEGIQGIPVINGAGNTAYFSTSEGIRAMDLSTGIAHMLRQQVNYTGKLVDFCYDGKYLMCSVDAADGLSMEFISTETGLLVGEDSMVRWIESFGTGYILCRESVDGGNYLFNVPSGDVMEFVMPETAYGFYPLPELGSVMTASMADDGCVVDLYDLKSGLRTASVTLKGVTDVRNVLGDPQGYVWFMDGKALYRWEPSKSGVEDETVHTQIWQVGVDPNKLAMDQCRAYAQTLTDKYGLKILVGEEAAQAPWHKMTPESQASAIQTALETVEEVFGIFPEGMLAQIATIYENDTVTISILADTGMDEGQQTWVDGNAYIALETGESFRRELLRTLYRVMDTYLMANTVRLDEWDAEKPAENRAMYFMEALTPDNKEWFEGWYVQGKLEVLCSAFRSAFKLWYHEEMLPWEQYLDKILY